MIFQLQILFILTIRMCYTEEQPKVTHCHGVTMDNMTEFLYCRHGSAKNTEFFIFILLHIVIGIMGT